jgi:hypothetical protein
VTLGGCGIARIIAHVCVPHSQVTDWGVLISGDRTSCHFCHQSVWKIGLRVHKPF